jgi:DNA-binding LytR/AlgR family response regulator
LRGVNSCIFGKLCYNRKIFYAGGKKMIKIVLCDDEKDYLQILEFKLNMQLDAFNDEYEIRSFNNLGDLKEHLNENHCDILFLDIMVNDINSVGWSIDNIKNKKTQIIFMTAFPEEAYALSESKFCYYIIKPRLTEEMLKSALSKALLNITQKNSNLTTIKIGHNKYTINFHDVLYIESLNNSLKLYLTKGEMIVYSTLKDFSSNLPMNFLKVHKSYIVNMNHITGFKPHKFTIDNGVEIPIPTKKYINITEQYESYIRNL